MGGERGLEERGRQGSSHRIMKLGSKTLKSVLEFQQGAWTTLHVKNVSRSLGGDHIGSFCGVLKEEMVPGTREVTMVMERSGQI